MRKLQFTTILLIVLILICCRKESDIDVQYFGSPIFDPNYGNTTLKKTYDNNLIVVYSSKDINYHSSIYLRKIDLKGNLLWGKIFDNEFSSIAFSLTQTLDSGYLISGSKTIDIDEHHTNIYLIKTNSKGEKVWDKTYQGGNDAKGNVVKQFSDGKILLLGRIDIDYYLLIKTDINGDTIWTKNVNNIFPCSLLNDMIITRNDEIVLAGSSLVKMNSDCNLIWGTNLSNFVSSIKQNSDNSFILFGSIGNMKSDFSLMKISSNGEVLWNKIFDYGSTDIRGDVIVLPNDEYVMIGTSRLDIGDVIEVLKTDQNGNLLWNLEKKYTPFEGNSGISIENITNNQFMLFSYSNKGYVLEIINK